MKALWKQKLFTDVKIVLKKVIGDVVFLEIRLEERARLSRYTYTGIKKVNHEDLNEILQTSDSIDAFRVRNSHSRHWIEIFLLSWLKPPIQMVNIFGYIKQLYC